MFIIKSPYPNSSEIAYTCDVIFQTFLGLPYRIDKSDDDFFHVTQGKKSIKISSEFFAAYETNTAASLPTKTHSWDSRIAGQIKLINYRLPILFGDAEYLVSKHSIQIGFDILGTVFFMLSRYEEINSKSLDNHNRFPSHESLAYKHGFLDRPIVDEDVEGLWHAIKSLWPDLQRKIHIAKVNATCDVDAPYEEAAKNLYRLCRANVANLVKNKTAAGIKQQFRNYIATQKGNYTRDRYHTFDWFMQTCENAGKTASFYFITDRSAGRIDGYYDLSEPRITKLIQKMHDRGHEVGVHSSYNTYQSPHQLRREREHMIEVCDRNNIKADIQGNRQHYLRWDSAQTPAHLNAAGYKYDTTGSYSDRVGFRYGTAREFPMWDWIDRKPLTLHQIPLILMECSIIADRYMGLGYSEEALKTMKKIKERSLTFGGTFTFLWHNSHLTTEKDRDFFTELVS